MSRGLCQSSQWELTISTRFLALSQISQCRSSTEGKAGSWGRCIPSLDIFCINFSNLTLKRSQSNWAQGKGEHLYLWVLLDTRSELTLIQRECKHIHGKHTHGSHNRVEVYRGQLINEVLAQLYFTLVTMGPQTHLVVILLAHVCPVTETNILRHWQKYHISFQIYELRAI